ncbi:hypothetical protein CDD80_7137 [Ophiocordyceps camponoti-rufipedis]|uniref:Secreted protein n=1 Tax=Ophiocordyceps camponoti-rufipedis TaxID=2004952 RepID=A0A2C5ZFQ7_9HYPO|nr:hypothetical protein CDD80_7137 [Ophiocordyceps camponoti-rufipedis]
MTSLAALIVMFSVLSFPRRAFLRAKAADRLILAMFSGESADAAVAVAAVVPSAFINFVSASTSRSRILCGQLLAMWSSASH